MLTHCLKTCGLLAALATTQAALALPPPCSRTSSGTNYVALKNADSQLSSVAWNTQYVEGGGKLSPKSGTLPYNSQALLQHGYVNCRGQYWTGDATETLTAPGATLPFATFTVSDTCKVTATTGEYQVTTTQDSPDHCTVTVSQK